MGRIGLKCFLDLKVLKFKHLHIAKRQKSHTNGKTEKSAKIQKFQSVIIRALMLIKAILIKL